MTPSLQQDFIKSLLLTDPFSTPSYEVPQANQALSDSTRNRAARPARRSTTAGFSLIELLVVVAIIGIIAAIAVPRLRSATRAANEGSALSSIRTIITAEHTYAASVPGGNYGRLGDLGDEKLLDQTLGGGGGAATTSNKSGYTFQATIVNRAGATPPSFVISGIPSSTGLVVATGTRRFGAPTSGNLYADTANLDTHYTTLASLTAGTSAPFKD
jgi:type IV pilus assembly protein PilA